MTNPIDDIPARAGVPEERAGGVARGAWDDAAQRIARDYFQDRRSERRWRRLSRILWVGLLLALLYFFMVSRGLGDVPHGPHTALIEVRGEIGVESEASAEKLVAGLKNAFEDRAAQAIVLRINSPGGSPVQAGIVNDEIRRLKAIHRKKVYAVVEETCASGAYYIAVAADEIFADKASIVGSIGVLMDSFGFVETMDKLGVERRLLTAGVNKGLGDPFSPLTDAHRAYIRAMLEQIHRQFIDTVRQGRGARLKETPDTFSGLFWSGEQALGLGLIDHLGSLDQVARDVIKAETVIDYTPKDNVAERLVKRFGASIGTGAVSALRGWSGLR